MELATLVMANWMAELVVSLLGLAALFVCLSKTSPKHKPKQSIDGITTPPSEVTNFTLRLHVPCLTTVLTQVSPVRRKLYSGYAALHKTGLLALLPWQQPNVWNLTPQQQPSVTFVLRS
nr:hypothetical protein [Enterobacter bugandensis]